MTLKEGIVAEFRVVLRYFPGSNKENHEKLRVVGVQAKV
jgi:hypothetical protein